MSHTEVLKVIMKKLLLTELFIKHTQVLKCLLIRVYLLLATYSKVNL